VGKTTLQRQWFGHNPHEEGTDLYRRSCVVNNTIGRYWIGELSVQSHDSGGAEKFEEKESTGRMQHFRRDKVSSVCSLHSLYCSYFE
jgi:hypothetical protein